MQPNFFFLKKLFVNEFKKYVCMSESYQNTGHLITYIYADEGDIVLWLFVCGCCSPEAIVQAVDQHSSCRPKNFHLYDVDVSG